MRSSRRTSSGSRSVAASQRSERTAFGTDRSHHHSPRHVAHSAATTRGWRETSPPTLAHSQRTAYYVDSSEEEEHGGVGEMRDGVFDTVNRHLDIDHTDRVDTTSSEEDSDMEDDAEELERFFYGHESVMWALDLLDGEAGMNTRLQSLTQHSAVSRGGTTGYRVSDDRAKNADTRQLPTACKTTTLVGLLRAAEQSKHRRSDKSRDVIRREVDARFDEIMESASKVSSWLQEDAQSFTVLLGELYTVLKAGDDVDATFLEPGPLGITFGCDGPGKAAFVSSIKHGSAAAFTPGLELKMELTSVNGQNVKKWAFDDVLALIGPERPLRLTFAYGSTHRLLKAAMPQAFGIKHEHNTHTVLRVRYIMWRMVTVKLRAVLGKLAELLDQQWVKGVFFNSDRRNPGLYPDEKDLQSFQEQVVKMAEQIDSPKNLMFSKARGVKIPGIPLVLAREPHHVPYSGLAKLARRSLITKLQRLQASNEGFKVLVMDATANAVLQQFATVDELSTEAGVCAIDLIENEHRKAVEIFDVVYIVSPTNSNLRRIIDDFGADELMYSRAHVFFTSDHLSKKLLKQFRYELGSHLVGEIKFLRMDFLSSEPELTIANKEKVVPMPLSGIFFNLNMPDVKKHMQSSVDGRRHDPDRTALRLEDEADSADVTLKTRHLVAERLAHVCAQLGELKPAIRWQQAVEEHMDLRTAYEKIEHSSPTARRVRSHTARTCKEIAEDLHGILKQYAENKTSCGIATSDAQDAEERREWHSENANFHSSGNTCVLIVDRTVDPLAPLLHDGTYESMYEELARMNVKKFSKDYSTVLSTQQFDQLRKLPLQKVDARGRQQTLVQQIEQKLERFTQDCPRPGTLEARVQQVKRGYPFSKDQEEFKLHKKMAGLLLQRFTNRKLQEASDCEVAMANGRLPSAGTKDLDIEILAHHLHNLPWEEDKARLTLAYLITHREKALGNDDKYLKQLLKAFQINELNRVRALLANLSGEDKRQYDYGPHRGGGQDFGGRYNPTVCLLAKDLVDHSLKENLFPFVKKSQLPGHAHHRRLKTDKSKQNTTAIAHRMGGEARKKGHSQKLSSSQLEGPVKPYSRVIVFVIGGVTKTEVAGVERLSRDLGGKFEVYLGGTEIIDHTHVLSEHRSDGLRAKAPSSTEDKSSPGRSRPKSPGGRGGALSIADATLKDVSPQSIHASSSSSPSSSSSSSDEEDSGHDSDADYVHPDSLEGRLTFSDDRSYTQLLKEFSKSSDQQLTLRDLCEAVGLPSDVIWPFPFPDSDAGMAVQPQYDHQDRALDTDYYRTGAEIFASLIPPESERRSPRRAKLLVARLAKDPAIQQALTVAEAERLLKRYDRDGLGRLTFHQLEACVLRGGHLNKYVPSTDEHSHRSRRADGTLESVGRQELRELFNKLSDLRGANPTVDIRRFAMCFRQPEHMAAPAVRRSYPRSKPEPEAQPAPEPEPEPFGSPYSDLATPIPEYDGAPGWGDRRGPGLHLSPTASPEAGEPAELRYNLSPGSRLSSASDQTVDPFDQDSLSESEALNSRRSPSARGRSAEALENNRQRCAHSHSRIVHPPQREFSTATQANCFVCASPGWSGTQSCRCSKHAQQGSGRGAQQRRRVERSRAAAESQRANEFQSEQTCTDSSGTLFQEFSCPCRCRCCLCCCRRTRFHSG